MKRQTFNVLFFIRKTKLKKSGETSIMLRITIEGQLTELQLKRDVMPTQWNQSKERCTGRDATSIEINRYLESVKLRLLDIHREMEDAGKLINPMEVKRRFLGLDEKHKMFFEVFQEHNDKCRELIGKDYAKVTISRFDTCLKYFREMLLKQYHLKDIPIKEINNAIIQDYIHFLKSKKNLQENTVIRYMKVVKKITNMALANDWIDKNPFMNIHFHEQEVHKEFLTKEELEILRTKVFNVPRLVENPLKVAPLIQSNLTPVKFFHSSILFILVFFVFFLSVMPGSTLNFVYKYNDSFLLLHLRSDSPKSSIRIA